MVTPRGFGGVPYGATQLGALTGNTCLAPGGTVADQPHPDAGLPCWAVKATDPRHSAGVNMTGAWDQGNVGRPDVLIAYIEGGVNYGNDSIKDGLDGIFLYRGELPYPEDASGQSRPRDRRGGAVGRYGGFGAHAALEHAIDSERAIVPSPWRGGARWPKYTGQWRIFGGVVGDPTMNGRLRFATGTREGELFVWNVAGDAKLDNSWSHYRGNDYNSGLYGQDTQRPESILDLRRSGNTLTWTAPGGDYELGKASSYEALACRDSSCTNADQLPGAPTPAAAGTPETFQLPALPPGTRYLAVRATNAAGNVSALGDVVGTR